MFLLICAWIKDRVKNCKAGDFRRHGTHYDVSVMILVCLEWPLDPFCKHGLTSAWIPAWIVGLKPVIQILWHVLRGWGRWLRYFTVAKAEVKYRASARNQGQKHNIRFEWPVSILIMTRYPLLPLKSHKTNAKHPRLSTTTGAIWFCRYRQCTPSQLWMHAPVAKERRLMTL